ncbi:acyltransferase family protein [Agrobacterium cavarae]|uniref:acyltransferase family protein n=1 Tax=Agrobacterium cavarae TaxID=2528239 RepID=UPI00289B2B4D|nr:acyltransferase [Agrobacterium cavarae]
MKKFFMLRSEPHREIELDFVRTVAILLAVGWHFNHFYSASILGRVILYPGASIGWAGVDLFFVLSGYLIGRIILREIRDKDTFDLKQFYVRRFFKLWPLLYISLLAMIAFSGVPLREFAPQIALHVQNYFPPLISSHLWSLAVEEHFYLIVAILLSALVRFRWSPRLVPLACIAAIISAPILRLLAYDAGFTPVQIQWQTQFRIDALATGILLAWIYVYRATYWVIAKRYRLGFALSAIIGTLILISTQKNSFFGSTAGYTIAYLTAACFVLSVNEANLFSPSSKASRLVVGISMISYAMYIWHVPVAGLLERALPKLGITEGDFLYVFLCYALSFAVAYLATVLVEQPFLQLRDRIFPRKSRAELRTLGKENITYEQQPKRL